MRRSRRARSIRPRRSTQSCCRCLRFIVSQGLPTAVKAGLEILGEPAGDPRLPLLPLAPEDRAELESILSAVATA